MLDALQVHAADRRCQARVGRTDSALPKLTGRQATNPYPTLKTNPTLLPRSIHQTSLPTQLPLRLAWQRTTRLVLLYATAAASACCCKC